MTNIDHQHSAETLEQKIDRLQNHAWIGDPAQRMGELHAVIATLWAEVQATRKAGCSPRRPQSTVPMLSVANNEYVSSTEIVPGVFLDPSVAVYIADRQGEVVSWNHEEIVADPSGFTAVVAAVAIATKYGPSAVRENIETGGAVLARLAEPSRFAIEHNPAQNSDRLYVLVDDKFGVAIIRTDEGVVVDVYPKNGFDTIASTYAFDSDAEESDDALTKPTETHGATHA